MNSSFKDYIYLLRTHHWVKNLLVLAPPFFGGVLFTNVDIFLRMVVAFLAFSLASSTGYIINDLFDKQTDALHSTKKLRPIASGKVSNSSALLMALATLFISLVLSLSFNKAFIFILIIYLLLILAYSFYLQYIVIVDVISIALGFVFRIEAGGIASGVSVSNWLLIMTILNSLLLAIGKRRFELESYNEKSNFRMVLTKYKKRYLDVALTIFAIVSIVAYSLYSFERGPSVFLITIPFVGFGIIRYIYLVRTKISGDPTESLFNDKWLFASALIWLMVTAVIITF